MRCQFRCFKLLLHCDKSSPCLLIAEANLLFKLHGCEIYLNIFAPPHKPGLDSQHQHVGMILRCGSSKPKIILSRIEDHAIGRQGPQFSGLIPSPSIRTPLKGHQSKGSPNGMALGIPAPLNHVWQI